MKLGCCPAVWFLVFKMTPETDQTVWQSIPEQEISGYRILETPKALRVIFPKSRIPEILEQCKDYVEEWSPAHYAKQTADALEKTREVILAPWPERKQTVIHTPTLAAPLSRDQVSSYLELLFPQKDGLYERVLTALEGGKKIIISSALG